MIGQLTGIVVADEADGDILLDVNGVAYELSAPLGTLGRARARSRSADAGPEGPITLHVHTHVREDALLLYGFASAREKLAFRTLLSVSSVGPKIALAVLSALPADELARAVASKDLGLLVAIPGVGKKTAERLLLELKDKFPHIAPHASTLAPTARHTQAPAKAELIADALTRLGYRPAEADRAIQNLGRKIDDAPVGELIREALAVLAR